MNDYQTLDGTTLRYKQTLGTQPGVIFLGGFMSDMTGTKAVYLENCCKEWGCSYLRFDYFGHGASSGTFAEGTLSRWLKDVLAVLDLTQGPQILVGSSMGAWLMILAALKRPERIKALVGIASAPDFLDAFDNPTEAEQKAWMEKGVWFVPSSSGEGRPYPIYKKLWEDSHQHRVLQSPILLDCPVRLFHGLEDQDVDWQRSLLLAGAFRSADVNLTLIKGGDHRLSKEEQLKQIARTLFELL